MINILIGIVSILFLTVGQTLLKLTMNKTGGLSISNLYYDFIKIFLHPLFIAGIAMYFVSGLLWLYILSKMEFSVVFPLVSLSYVFALFIGYYIFNESISLNKCFGIIFILIGVFCIVKNNF